MAEPVRHGFLSGTATTAWETAKGTVKGVLFPPVVGAVIAGVAGAATLGIAGAAIGALIGGSAIVGTIAGGLLGVGIGGVAGVSGGGVAGTLISALTWPWMAGAGAVVGLLKGGKRVSRESQAYQEKVELHQRAGLSKLEYVAQQGYMAGRHQGQQEGAMMVAEKLREMQYAQLAQKMGPAKGPHAAAEDQRRAEAAKASPQLGA